MRRAATLWVHRSHQSQLVLSFRFVYTSGMSKTYRTSVHERESARRWYEKNKVSVDAYRRDYRARNRDRLLAAAERKRREAGIQPRIRATDANRHGMIEALKMGQTFRQVAQEHRCSAAHVQAMTKPSRAEINASAPRRALRPALLAKDLGLIRYRGRVCARHPELEGERYTSTRKCRGCLRDGKAKRWPRIREEENQKRRMAPEAKAAKAAARAAVQAKREVKRAAERDARKAQREKEREANRAGFAARKQERKREERKEYYRRNPVKKKVLRARRRAREREAAVPLTAGDRARVEVIYSYARQRTLETGEQWDVHHIVPLSRGGLHHPDNLEAIPAVVNNAIADQPLSALEYILS